MRTSWSDPKGLYLAVKGGSPSLNHGHMDAGSFVFDAGGVRWASDLGMQSYESLESKGFSSLFDMKQSSQRWTVFRLNNFAHNTLTIDGQLQQVAGKAPVISHSEKPSFMNAVIDLTSIYQGVTKLHRGVAIADEKYAVVRDEITTGEKEVILRWSMVTTAKVIIAGNNKATLRQGDDVLELTVQGSGDIRFKSWSAEPATSYDAPNPGVILVGFEVRIPAATAEAINVLLVPKGAVKKPVRKVQSLTEWGR
nr:heparinase II/III family protein [Hufsiella ginkgonis]